MYLTKFVSRYRSTKLERARELFQQATAQVPPKYAKNLFLLYAKLEETYGLAKHALAIYSAATKAVLPEEQLDMFCVYIARVSFLPAYFFQLCLYHGVHLPNRTCMHISV